MVFNSPFMLVNLVFVAGCPLLWLAARWSFRTQREVLCMVFTLLAVTFSVTVLDIVAPGILGGFGRGAVSDENDSYRR